MMNNSAAEAEYARAKTSVWWDIENCPVPKGWDARGIAQILNSAVTKMNYFGPLSISCYGNTDLIPNSVQQALSSTGISLNHVPSGRKDASDKKILVDMFLWVVENPAPANIMLISGDGDFSDALHRLRMRRYNILLAHPQQVSASLVASANTTWLWRSLLASGCCPLTQCESSVLVDNGQDVSEHVMSRQPMDSWSGSRSAAGDNKLKGIYVPKASNQLLKQETRRKKLQKNCNETGTSARFCKVCNVACQSFEIFTKHLSAKEHAAQCELKHNLELLGEPENMAVAPCEKDAEMTNKVVEAGVEASAHSGSCSVVKKQAEALVDAKNIEERVQDNDLQSQDAQESMKCLEKQKKELMETCTTSERSGREFWHEINQRLERDGVAPLNVDCVFSELSRDFQVPKEVRECFDAILKKLEPTQNEIVIEKSEGMLKHGLEMKSGEPENAPARPTEHLEEDMNNAKKKRKKKKSTVIEDKAKAYVCSFCSVICISPAVFESHLKGRKHAATIKKHTAALLDDGQIEEENFQDNSLPKEMIEELRIQPGEAPEKQKKEQRERCATSERSVEELFQTFEKVQEKENKSLPNAECNFKQLQLSQDANLTWELENIPNQNLEMNSGNPESNFAGATEHPEDYMDKKRNGKMTKDRAESEAYVCSICNVICDCPIVFESHLTGRRHATRIKKHAAAWELKHNLELLGEPENMAVAPCEKDVEMTNKVVEAGVEASAHSGSCSVVKKQAEALVDAKNIEERVQDNDLQSQDAQESLKCLEKQKKELMETCTTSERSGREFWHDFKQRLERDDVAPLNVDCVFSELSRDFQVPKEVRECFDAILKKLEPTQNEIVIEKSEGMLKHGLEMKSGEPENTPAGPTEHLEEDMNNAKKKRKKKKSTVIEDKAEAYVCSFCSVICDSPAVFESHLKGRKHAAMIKKNTAALLDDGQIQDNGLPKEMIEELRIQPGEAPQNIDYLEKQKKEQRERCATSERSVEEIFQYFEEVQEKENKSLPNAECHFTELNPEFLAPKEAREWVDPIIKQLQLSQDANLTWELENIPNQNLEMNSGDPESNFAGATEHPEDYMDKKRNGKMTKDGAESEAYVCSICNVICDCPIVFESHLMGRRHAARVKKHAAAVLFVDKKILEESLKERDHPRDTLVELQYQPKEAQENTKEVFQSIKGGVDIENEQVPSAEFPEPEEARERLDSIVKRLASERAEMKKKKNGASATEIRVCEWCNVMCPSQMDFESHLRGKKHAATVKKHVPVMKEHISVVGKQAGTKYIYVRKNGS